MVEVEHLESCAAQTRFPELFRYRLISVRDGPDHHKNQIESWILVSQSYGKGVYHRLPGGNKVCLQSDWFFAKLWGRFEYDLQVVAKLWNSWWSGGL